MADWQTYKSAVIHADIGKIELFGIDYIFDFISEWVDDLKYKIYVTDALKNIIEIAARLGSSEVSYGRFIDILRPETKENASNLSAEEIIEQVTQKAGLKVKKSGGEK